MKLKQLLVVNAVVGLAFGIPFMLAANYSMKVYGIEMCADGLSIVRYYGISLACFGLLAWFFKDVADAAAQRAFCLGFGIGCLGGACVALYNQLAVGVIPLVWLTVALYLLFAVGYCYFFVMGKK